MPPPAVAPSSSPCASVPFTPDSGSIAIRCGSSSTASARCRMATRWCVIRDGRIKRIEPARVAAMRRRDAPAGARPDRLHLPARASSTCTRISRTGPRTRRICACTSRARATRRCARRTENAAATLLAGFTSVRNVGTYVLGADTALRDVINRGSAAGPRMQVSGPYLTIPHGGGDLYVPDFKEPEDNAAFHAGVARGPSNSANARRSCSPPARTCSRSSPPARCSPSAACRARRR